jgi:hypothetical protein
LRCFKGALNKAYFHKNSEKTSCCSLVKERNVVESAALDSICLGGSSHVRVSRHRSDAQIASPHSTFAHHHSPYSQSFSYFHIQLCIDQPGWLLRLSERVFPKIHVRGSDSYNRTICLPRRALTTSLLIGFN